MKIKKKKALHLLEVNGPNKYNGIFKPWFYSLVIYLGHLRHFLQVIY